MEKMDKMDLMAKTVQLVILEILDQVAKMEDLVRKVTTDTTAPEDDQDQPGPKVLLVHLAPKETLALPEETGNQAAPVARETKVPEAEMVNLVRKVHLESQENQAVRAKMPRIVRAREEILLKKLNWPNTLFQEYNKIQNIHSGLIPVLIYATVAFKTAFFRGSLQFNCFLYHVQYDCFIFSPTMFAF